MVLVTPTFALATFVIILVISGLIAWYMKDYETFDKCWFHSFIVILVGLGIFVTFMFYFNLVSVQNEQQVLTAIQELSRINDSVLDSVLNEIKEASRIIPNFVLSITPLTSPICSSTLVEDPVNAETCTEKMILSYRIFSLWQDVIATGKFLSLDAMAYISNFLQRANSKQLYQEWTANKINFSLETQTFGDLLFEYALPITNQTAEEYTNTAKKLIDDPRYKNIFRCSSYKFFSW